MSDSPPLSPALVFFFSVSFHLYVFLYLPGGTSGKTNKQTNKQTNPLASAGDMRLGFNPWIEEIPWGRKQLCFYSPFSQTPTSTPLPLYHFPASESI